MPYADKATQNEYQNAKLKVKRKFWFAKLGNCCKQCGATERLELDHVDPKTKVAHRIWSWSDERIAGEIAKCQLLCHDCHVEKSRAAAIKPLVHGTLHGYDSRWCRCELCKAAKRAAIYAWRARVGGRVAINKCGLVE